MVLLFHATYISVDLVYHEIFLAKVAMGGIKVNLPFCRNPDVHSEYFQN